MFTSKNVMISLEKKEDIDRHELRIRHNDLITTLKNSEDEEKYNVFRFKHMAEYDHEIHSEAALNSLFIIFGESKEQLSHQFVPPEMVRYFTKKKERPEERYIFTKDYYNEIWQIGVIMYQLMFPEHGFPFKSNSEYRNYCYDNMEAVSSDLVMKMKSYNTLYTD